VGSKRNTHQHGLTLNHVALLALVVLLLAGCGRAYGSYEPSVQPIAQAEVTGSMQYQEGLTEGPTYTFSVNVPESWVGAFEVKNNGNTLEFIFDAPDRKARIFTVTALSERQFWEQVGSYPGQYQDIVFTGDTYFIYSLPVDAFWSGLTQEQYDVVAAEVPAVMTGFAVTYSN
jgi:hypothetical protein